MIQRQAILRVAMYGRVSSEDQAEKQTIQTQREFLRNYCTLYGLDVVGEYIDDGISGAKPLGERDGGRRLLEDARLGRFTTVLVYKLDRIGRTLRVIVNAHDELEAAGCAIRSATEPFDTDSPFGRAMFQFLGVIAELERANILERTTAGRHRAAREGRHTGGSIPMGYELGDRGALVPSDELMPGTDLTEADFIRDLYRRIAAGSTLRGESTRLSALGVPTGRRLGRGKLAKPKKNALSAWSPSTISTILKNPIYKGEGVFKPRGGGEPVPRPAPALVEADLWQRALDQLRSNLRMGPGDPGHVMLLRGLVRCAHCRRSYVGGWSSAGRKRAYRCRSQFEPAGRIDCNARLVQAEWLESRVWARVAEFCRNPGAYLADAQNDVRERLQHAEAIGGEVRSLQAALGEKNAERERVMTLFRRGRVSLEMAETEIEEIAREETALRERLAIIEGRQRLALASEAQLAEVAGSLSGLREQIDEIEATNDRTKMRALIELLVREIEITTEGEGKRKVAHVAATLAFDQTVQCAEPSDSTSRIAQRIAGVPVTLRAGRHSGAGTASAHCRCPAPAAPA